jgi:hypothetical protein
MMENFDKPLDTWIEESVEVPTFTPHVNEAESRVEITQGKKTVKQRTIYTKGVERKVICSNHHYVSLDRGRYLFRCTKCDWSRVAYPHTYRFENNKLINRKTGEHI